MQRLFKMNLNHAVPSLGAYCKDARELIPLLILAQTGFRAN